MLGWVAVNELGRRIGESHPQARYSDHVIELVFALREEGMTQALIAEKLEMTRRYVGRVLSGARRCQTPARFRRGP